MVVKKIRRKFFITTMVLLTAVFAIMKTMDYQFTKYLEEEKNISLDDDYDNYKMIGDIALTAGGFALLLVIVIFLSRFVTEPAKKALECEKQFISDASHELKTPLAAISINAQALKTEMGNNKHIDHILSETERMNGLIQKLLKLSYADEAGRKIEKQKFVLSKACEEMALTLESNIFERQINFNYEIADDIFYFGNEDDIKQVIVILLDNAMKHTPKYGNIFFKLQKADKVVIPAGSSHVSKKSAVITVENSGEGISEEDLPHIFERFYRIDKSRSSDSSNANSDSYGLGLAIAKSILAAHNATITATSEIGKGVKFEIKM